MPQNFTEALSIFFIYAFLGWCAEVAYAALSRGEFVNRGFLGGPVCPIYGFGVLAVTTLLDPLRPYLLPLFLASTVLTSALELAAGWILERFFMQKWWDYSDTPFNLGGYICLKFSILWGLACVFIVRLVHPGILGLVRLVPDAVLIPILCVFSLVILADLAYTASALTQLTKKLRAVDEIEEALRRISDTIGAEISDKTIITAEKGSELREKVTDRTAAIRDDVEEYRAELKKDLGDKKTELHAKAAERRRNVEARLSDRLSEAQSLIDKYRTILNSHHRTHSRILRAFPTLSRGKHILTADRLRRFHADFTERLDNFRNKKG